MTRQGMTVRHFLVACLSVGLGLTTAGAAWGQYSTSGMFGSRSLGGSVSGRSDNLSTAGTPGTRLQQQEQVGQITGNERFLRDARQAGQFVGSDSSESSFVGAMSSASGSAGGLGGRGMMGGMTGMTGGLMGGSSMYGGLGQQGMLGRGGMNQRGMNQFGNARGMNQLGRMGGRRNVNLRTQMTVGFRYPQLQGAEIRTTIERRLNSTTRIQKRGALQMELSERTATLRGVVATEEDRALAIRMARLEPGISEVVDQLSVAASEETTTTPEAQDQ